MLNVPARMTRIVSQQHQRQRILQGPLWYEVKLPVDVKIFKKSKEWEFQQIFENGIQIIR